MKGNLTPEELMQWRSTKKYREMTKDEFKEDIETYIEQMQFWCRQQDTGSDEAYISMDGINRGLDMVYWHIKELEEY